MATNQGQGQTRQRRSKNDFSDRRKNQKGKKPLPEPTHIGHFGLMLLLKVCRTILFVDTSVKIGVYFVGVMVGSVICDLFLVPKSYFADKRNFFNVYFCKLGWGWTLVLLAPYIALTSWVFCYGRWQAVRRHLMRLVVATVQWYVCTSAFGYIERALGVCTDSDHLDKVACIAHGKGWLSFDISGHVFILIHNMLTISEEMKTFKYWRKLGEMLEDEDLQSKRKVSIGEISEAKTYYKEFTPYIKVVFVAIAFLSVLWELMLLTSVVYRFHVMPEKAVAVCTAVLCWFLSYRMLYPSGIEWLPWPPGKTDLDFMRSK